MAYRYAAEIHIGGKVPEESFELLVELIVNTRGSLEGYGRQAATSDEARNAFYQGKTVDLYADQIQYGKFPELEDFLVLHGIHFNHHCEAYCDFEGENVYYRGGDRTLSMPATQNGELLARHEEIAGILNDNELNDSDKVRGLRALIFPPEITPLEPVQLV